jgi:hypothetical protein
MSQSLLYTIILVFAVLLAISGGLEFKPTPTWAELDGTALGLESLPTITDGSFVDELKKRQTVAQDATCGWINGNAGKIVLRDDLGATMC